MEDMIGQGGRGDYPKRKQKHLNLNLAEYLVNGLELETERSNSNHDSCSNSIHSAPPGGITRQLNIKNTASRRSNSLTDHNTSAVGQCSVLSDLLSDLDDDDNEDEDDNQTHLGSLAGVSVYVPHVQRQYHRSRRALNSTYMLPLIIILVGTAITLCHLRYHHLQNSSIHSPYNSTQEPSEQSLQKMGLSSRIVQDNIFHLMIATIMLAICILAKRLIFFRQQQRRDNKEALKSSILYPETVDNIA